MEYKLDCHCDDGTCEAHSTPTQHTCCDGECNHDSCCGKVSENCPQNAQRTGDLGRIAQCSICKHCKTEHNIILPTGYCTGCLNYIKHI